MTLYQSIILYTINIALIVDNYYLHRDATFVEISLGRSVWSHHCEVRSLSLPSHIILLISTPQNYILFPRKKPGLERRCRIGKAAKDFKKVNMNEIGL